MSVLPLSFSKCIKLVNSIGQWHEWEGNPLACTYGDRSFKQTMLLLFKINNITSLPLLCFLHSCVSCPFPCKMVHNIWQRECKVLRTEGVLNCCCKHRISIIQLCEESWSLWVHKGHCCKWLVEARLEWPADIPEISLQFKLNFHWWLSTLPSVVD